MGKIAKNRQEVHKRGIKDGFSHKASRNHPLRYSQRLFNKIIARRRFRIEQAFGTLKRKFRIDRASYFGCYISRSANVLESNLL